MKKKREGDGEEEWNPLPVRLLSWTFLCTFPSSSTQFYLSTLHSPMFCLCFNVDSCLACSGKVLWVPSFQLMPYPWPSLMPYPSFPSFHTVVLWPPVHACEILPESVACAEYVHESVTKKEPELEPQSITALGPDVLIFLSVTRN